MNITPNCQLKALNMNAKINNKPAQTNPNFGNKLYVAPTANMLTGAAAAALAAMTLAAQNIEKAHDVALKSPSEYRAKITEVDEQKYVDKLPKNSFKFSLKKDKELNYSAYIFDGKENELVKKGEDGKFYAKYDKAMPDFYATGEKEVNIGDVIVYNIDEVREIIPDIEFAERYTDKNGNYDALYEVKPGIENSVNDLKMVTNIIGINLGYDGTSIYDYSISPKPEMVYLDHRNVYEFKRNIKPWNEESAQALNTLSSNNLILPLTSDDLKERYGIDMEKNTIFGNFVSRCIYTTPNRKTFTFDVADDEILKLNGLIGYLNEKGVISGRNLLENVMDGIMPKDDSMRAYIKEVIGDSAITQKDKFNIEKVTRQKYNPGNVEPVMGDECNSIMLIGAYRYPYTDKNGDKQYIILPALTT